MKVSDFIVEVKYSKIPICDKKHFSTRAEAEKYAKAKEKNNPMVRWTTIREVETEESTIPGLGKYGL